jgi:hypothetical protein
VEYILNHLPVRVSVTEIAPDYRKNIRTRAMSDMNEILQLDYQC